MFHKVQPVYIVQSFKIHLNAKWQQDHYFDASRLKPCPQCFRSPLTGPVLVQVTPDNDLLGAVRRLKPFQEGATQGGPNRQARGFTNRQGGFDAFGNSQTRPPKPNRTAPECARIRVE